MSSLLPLLFLIVLFVHVAFGEFISCNETSPTIILDVKSDNPYYVTIPAHVLFIQVLVEGSSGGVVNEGGGKGAQISTVCNMT